MRSGPNRERDARGIPTRRIAGLEDGRAEDCRANNFRFGILRSIRKQPLFLAVADDAERSNEPLVLATPLALVRPVLDPRWHPSWRPILPLERDSESAEREERSGGEKDRLPNGY